MIKLSVNPFLGKPLQGRFKGFRSYRVGDYRITYRFDATTLAVRSIKDRKEVYR